MTREEFIKKAEEKGYTLTSDRGGKENSDRIYKYGLENANADEIDRMKKIIDFSDVFSGLHLFKMTDENKDFEYKCIVGYLVKFWDDIGESVIDVAKMKNTSHKHIAFFMSETGSFYDEKHKKITDDIDTFLEYFLGLPCDYHEQPDEKTYQALRDGGWYEGRKVDITAVIERCRELGTELTETQKKVLSEFAGIETDKFMLFDAINTSWVFTPHTFNDVFKADTIYVGLFKGMAKTYLATDGRLFHEIGQPYGLDTMEAFHIMQSSR